MSGINADDLGLTLVAGIPMALYLMHSYSGRLRAMVRATLLVYVAVTPVAILLTGTRSAFLAGLLSLSMAPLMFPKQSRGALIATMAILVIGTGATFVVVPQGTWARVLSVKSELLEGGAMTGRRDIWMAGLDVFPEHPFLGIGAGAYGTAVLPQLGKLAAPHNLPIAVLVEQGIVGLTIFGGLLAACGVAIVRMPSSERKLWAVLMLCWLIGVLSNNWEVRKVTWLVFGMMAAQDGLAAMDERRLRSPRKGRAESHAPQPRYPQPVYSHRLR